MLRKQWRHLDEKQLNTFTVCPPGVSTNYGKKTLICNICISFFFASVAAKKLRKSEVMEGILETMETDGGAED